MVRKMILGRLRERFTVDVGDAEDMDCGGVCEAGVVTSLN